MFASLVAAAALALAPEKPVGPGDDFNEVIAGNELALKCEAVRVYKSDPDSMRVVIFRCAVGEILIPFIYQGAQGWYPIERAWTWTPETKTEGGAI